jgi:uncharacterized protein
MGTMRPAADRDLHRESRTACAGGLEIDEACQGVRAGLLDRLIHSPDMNICSDTGSETGARVAAFLDSHHILSLATLGPDGPHAVNLFYVRDEYSLLWVSDPSSRHSIHLEHQPRATATIANDCLDYSRINGLQVFGEANKIADATECEQSRRRLELRFPFMSDLGDAPDRLRDAYRRAEFYRLKPSRIVLIDNSRGFGFKEAIDFRNSGVERGLS